MRKMGVFLLNDFGEVLLEIASGFNFQHDILLEVDEIAQSAVLKSENSTFNIPESYLYARLEDYQKYFEETYCEGMGLEAYLSAYGYSVDQMQLQWISQINSQIQAELVFAAMVENENLTVDEDGHEAYIQNIINANGEYFPDADSIHKYAGAGNVEAGEAYMKNQAAVRENFIANYDK